MTDEEKKEFEEFLQWKAERKEKEKKEQESKEKVSDAEKSYTENPAIEQNEEKESDHSLGCVLVFLVVFILFIIFINLATISSEKEELINKSEITNVDPIEKARQDSIYKEQKKKQKEARIAELKNSVKIKSAYISRPNSAGGVDVYFYYKNVSKKTIKYLYWSGYVENAVGDYVKCEIRDTYERGGKDTGPIKPGRTGGGYWECMWYNSSAKKLVLTNISIEYMDGTNLEIGENELKYIR